MPFIEDAPPAGAGGELIHVCRVYVPIKPQGNQRVNPRGMGGTVYLPKQTKQYQEAIRLAVQDALGGSHHEPITDPIRLALRFQLTPPAKKPKKYRQRPHYVKPDIDNAVKAIMDALNPKPKAGWVGVWKDDVQVVDLRVRKDWHISEPGVTIIITRIV